MCTMLTRLDVLDVFVELPSAVHGRVSTGTSQGPLLSLPGAIQDINCLDTTNTIQNWGCHAKIGKSFQTPPARLVSGGL